MSTWDFIETAFIQAVVYFVIFLALFSVTGCASTCDPVIKTEYQEVQVPTVYKLKRPERPNLENCESVPSCIQDLVSYTTNLEYIVDGVK